MVRLKHRYLLVNILYPDADTTTNTTKLKTKDSVPYAVQFHQPSSDRLDARSLTQMIRNGVSELFGDYGSGMIAASLQVKYFSSATSTAIIRVSRDHYRLVWAALTFTVQLPPPVRQPCVLRVVRVSGTIRKAEEEAICRAQLSIRRAQQTSGSSDVMKIAAIADHPMDTDTGFANGIEDLDEEEDEDEDE